MMPAVGGVAHSSGTAAEGLYAAVEAIAGGAQDEYFFLQVAKADCWIIHHPPLNFYGAWRVGGVTHGSVNMRPRATSADGPQAEERATAADAHRIARVPCEEFLFFVFLVEALKNNKSCQIANCVFLIEQS
jgi:hypothetical protein